MPWQRRYPPKYQRRSDDDGKPQSDGEPQPEWDEEVFAEAIEDLDKTCAKVRHVIYELRRLMRAKQERGQ